jgi:hypothetical protein
MEPDWIVVTDPPPSAAPDSSAAPVASLPTADIPMPGFPRAELPTGALPDILAAPEPEPDATNATAGVLDALIATSGMNPDVDVVVTAPVQVDAGLPAIGVIASPTGDLTVPSGVVVPLFQQIDLTPLPEAPSGSGAELTFINPEPPAHLMMACGLAALYAFHLLRLRNSVIPQRVR